MAKQQAAGAPVDADVAAFLAEKAKRAAKGRTAQPTVQAADGLDSRIAAMLKDVGLPVTPSNIADFKRQLIGRLVREQTGVQSLAFADGPEGFAEMTATYHVPLIGHTGPKSGKLSFLNDNAKVRFQGTLCTLQTGLYQYEPREGSNRAGTVEVLAEWSHED